MKTAKMIFLVMAILGLAGYAHALELGSARISFLDGDVQMRTTESEDWVPAAVNTPLDEGDEIWVPEGGRMEFQLSSGTAVRLRPEFCAADIDPERTSSSFISPRGTPTSITIPRAAM